ncbi:MAG TPA: DUF4230 domain-containing protein [Draconibacterium sp.]|nr:DUF4230 domain-containing protein [Draconibacterium sp.]
MKDIFMETLIIIGLLIGLVAGIAITSLYYKNLKQKQLQTQSVILMEKIKQVCKLITVEGEFTEIFTHRDEQKWFFKLLQLEKKALLLVKAKVMIGFDLSKINIEINTQKKLVSLTRFPFPEILSIDSDIEYYDIQRGMINKFSEKDLNNVNKKSKEFIREKVAESELFSIARKQASDTIGVIRELIDSVGWKLQSEHKILEPHNETMKIGKEKNQ